MESSPKNTVVPQPCIIELDDQRDSHHPVSLNTQKKERWNSSPLNIARLLSTYWCFVLLGCNDSSYGVSSVDISIFCIALTDDKPVKTLIPHVCIHWEATERYCY